MGVTSYDVGGALTLNSCQDVTLRKAQDSYQRQSSTEGI